MSLKFSGQNLQGRSFPEDDLEDADFSDADIRGINFKNKRLVGANFKGAKAGLPRSRAISLVIISLVLALFSGFCSFNTAPMEVALLQAGKLSAISASLIILTALLAFATIAVRDNFETAFGTACGTMLIVIPLTLLFAWLGLIRGTLTDITKGIAPGTIVAGGLILGAGVFAVAIAMAGLVSQAAALLVAATGLLFIAASITGGIGFIAAATVADRSISAEDLAVGSITGTTPIPEFDVALEAVRGSVAFAGVTIFLGGVIVAGLGLYLGWRISVGDERHNVLRQVAVAFAATGGTNFQGADLSDATFERAILKTTDFRRATLTRTNWFQAQKLSFARLDDTYLSDSSSRTVVTTRQGANQKFDRQNLQGVNLQYANLVNASFINTDLSKADLQYADLSRASLVRAQLESANLKGADLTGACIENWSITQITNFEGIVCDYIYLRQPTTENQDPCRIPHEGRFKKNQFFEFIQSFLNAVDLEHEEGFNPKATVLAIAELSEKYQQILNVVALEKRGKTILVKVELPPFVERTNFVKEYCLKYKKFKNIRYKPSRDRQYIEEKSEQLEKLIEKLYSSPRAVKIEYLYNEQGLVITGGEFQDTYLQSFGMSLGEAKRIQQIDRKINAALKKLPETSNKSQQYKTLLRELLTEVKGEIHFKSTDKSDALEQILLLAINWDNEQDSARQNAREAVAYLRGMRVEFPDATKFCEVCDRALPEIDNLIKNKLESKSNQGDLEMTENRNFDLEERESSNRQTGNFGIGQMNGGTIQSGAKVAGTINEAPQSHTHIGHFHNERGVTITGGSFGPGIKVAEMMNESQDPELVRVAAELQELLEELGENHSTETLGGRMRVASEAISSIERSPDLSARILSALRSGGVAAFEQLLNHPAASFLLSALADWQQTRED